MVSAPSAKNRALQKEDREPKNVLFPVSRNRGCRGQRRWPGPNSWMTPSWKPIKPGPPASAGRATSATSAPGKITTSTRNRSTGYCATSKRRVAEPPPTSWHGRPGRGRTRAGEAVKKTGSHRRGAETQRKALLFSTLCASASLRCDRTWRFFHSLGRPCLFDRIPSDQHPQI